jgi:hypothetical protein
MTIIFKRPSPPAHPPKGEGGGVRAGPGAQPRGIESRISNSSLSSKRRMQ